VERKASSGQPRTARIGENINIIKELVLSQEDAPQSLITSYKAEHLYSALHGIQTTLKCSGMDHTVYLQ